MGPFGPTVFSQNFGPIVHKGHGYSIAGSFEAHLAGMRSMIAPLARPFLLGLPPFQFTTTTLCGLIGVLAPTDQLHVNRLRYVKRLVQHCPAVLWNLLHALSDAPHSWISSLRESLSWLCKHYGPNRLPGPDAPFEDWWSLIALAERWNGFVKRVARACLSFNKAVAQQLVWEKSVEAQLLRDGALAPLNWFLLRRKPSQSMRPKSINIVPLFNTLPLMAPVPAVAEFFTSGVA